MNAYSNLIYRHIRISDHTLNSNLPPNPFRLHGNSRHKLGAASLGVLGGLPPEILQEILVKLDLNSLVDFWLSDQRAAEFLDSLPQYDAITTHAGNALRGALSIETGGLISCKLLHKMLCTPHCDNCGDFGTYLYLLTCKQVCFLFLSNEKQYPPLRITYACWEFGLEKDTVKTLPRMRVIPGIYSPNEKKAKSIILVDYRSAVDAGTSRCGSLGRMEE